MYLSAKNFIAALEAKNINYEVEERENDTLVSCKCALDNTKVEVRMFFTEQHVALRCFRIVHLTEDQFAGALIACNKCNVEYRWVKFVIDDDMDLNAYDDAVVSPDTAGEEIFELLSRMLGIIDDCYPTIMKGIWG